MKTANVSFGKVLAVYGKQDKIKKVNSILQNDANEGKLTTKNVTSCYINAPAYGVLGKAAKQGDTIQIYITGDDVQKVNNHPQWDTIEGILSHMSDCVNIAKMKVNDIVKLVKEG